MSAWALGHLTGGQIGSATISELLGLVWSDLDLDGGELHVRAQLSRAHRGTRRSVSR
jgi:integrase